jgi:hypothetical protein
MHCAVHPGESATTTCRRCGDAACASCLQQNGNGSLCLACQEWSIERRLELLTAERLVRALGIAIACVSLGWLGVCLALFVATASDPKLRGPLLLTWVPILCVVLALLIYGISLARARTARRWPAAVAGIGMLPMLPVGTLMGAGLLMALVTGRVRKVFSKEHLTIVANTPHVRLGSSFALLAVGAAFVLPIASVLAFVIFYNVVGGAPP